ncbi:hypothetical protein ACS0TY_024125 [Phlomoides rotata]
MYQCEELRTKCEDIRKFESKFFLREHGFGREIFWESKILGEHSNDLRNFLETIKESTNLNKVLLRF